LPIAAAHVRRKSDRAHLARPDSERDLR
jgi:hypothetical protein